MVDRRYREGEIQALIVLGELNDPIETPNNNFYSFYPKSIKQAQAYFRRFALDLTEVFDALVRRELAYKQGDAWLLTKRGQQAARQARRRRPPIWYWYKDFYIAIENSRAFSLYCERVYGKDLSQHGFSNVDELHWMLDLVKLDETIQLLDIGCGNGRISEYISDKTLARVMGIDYIPEAIAQAKRRTANKRDRLCFQVGNIDELDSVGKRFNVILSIDSIFFGQDLTATLANLKRLLKPDGEMVFFCGEDLSTPLRQNRLACTVYSRSREHHQHLQLKRRVATGLRKDFEAEGNRFIWENIMAESLDDANSYDSANCSRPRYLYRIWTQPAN
ncbi:MAG: class I SAM-dependent methyltransferase [Candidatus Bathyarchaeota archaeon]|nr:class I SAM-dependent methyltransferase [Candidatus Bathyarchaeota archaeon]